MLSLLFIVATVLILAAAGLYFLADSARIALFFGPLTGIQFFAKSLLALLLLGGFLYFMGHIFGLV